MREACFIMSRIVVLGLMLFASATAGAQKFEFYNPDRVSKDIPGVNVQVRTNLLYDALLCPNVGFELQAEKGFAFNFDYGEAWWNSFSRNKFYSLIYFQTEIRKYFGRKAQHAPYGGHHIGLYLQMGMYDLESGGRGHISEELDDNIGFGISYGYSFRLGDRLSVDCTLGLGYLSSKYESYLPVGDRYVSTGENKKTWLGPTKLEASLVWNISKKNRR